MIGKSQVCSGCENQVSGDDQGEGKNRQIDDVLALVGNRPLRQKLLELAGGHQAAGERERAENDLQPQHRHRERRHFGCLQIVFRRADERDAEGAEGVAQRGSLRDGRHLHHAQGHADDRAQNKGDGDPPVFDDPLMKQRPTDRQEHPQLAGTHASSRRGRRTHPL